MFYKYISHLKSQAFITEGPAFQLGAVPPTTPSQKPDKF